MIDRNRFPIVPPLAFGNVEYALKITHTVETDCRIMSFVDTLWGFEVTGGYDQFEPLTVLWVSRSGYAKRAGIRVNDIIVQINDTYADTLTLKEAQLLIRESGKYLRIYVKGDGEEEPDEYTVDFWFTPPKQRIFVENKWRDNFPWNDRKKKRYRESNCFMVPSKAEEIFFQRMIDKHSTVPVTESADNVVESANPQDNVANGHDASEKNSEENTEKPENSDKDEIDKGR